MNRWSHRRKRIILALIFFVLIILIGLPIFFWLYRAPTCFDNKWNGSEAGVDCGGSCQLLCTTDSLPLILKGDPRVLKVRDSTFEVVALIENPNISGEIYEAKYTFKLYNVQSTIPIKVIEGRTYVPRGTTFALFEGPFPLEEGVTPARAILEWKKESLLWQRNITQMPELTVGDLSLSREDTNPRLDASIENHSLENISNIDLIALVSDKTGSVFAASKTFIDKLPIGGRTSVVFTWPEPFGEKALNIDVIIRILPDRSFIR